MTVAVLANIRTDQGDTSMKSVREHMDMHAAYRELGSYRAAAEICGTTPKTVKRSVKAALLREAGIDPVRHNYDAVADLVAETVARTKGRITAKRLLPVAAAAGYSGSARNFRRLVAEDEGAVAIEEPPGPTTRSVGPGRHGGLRLGRDRPAVRLLRRGGLEPDRASSPSPTTWAPTRTMAALAECFEYIGGVPKTALTDRMGCLKGGTVAGLVIPTPAYVRFATHYGFRPDFCEGADPESKGLVENLVGYVKSDLMIPEQLTVSDLATANAKGRLWLDEVNGAVHSEISAIPAERLVSERELFCELPTLRAAIGKVVTRKVDQLSCVRFGSARYSVPNVHIGRQVELRVRDGVITMMVGLGEIIAEHLVVSPGETSIIDDHYGGPRPSPLRAVRPKSCRREGVLCSGPGGRCLHQGSRRSRDDRAGP